MLLKRFTLLIFLLVPHLAMAEEYNCHVDLSYTWEKTVNGKKVVQKEALEKVQEQGTSADYVKTRLSRMTAKLEEDAMNICRGRHEGAELCLVDRLQEDATKLYEMPLEKRQAVIAKAKEGCLRSAGRCLQSKASEVECYPIKP